MKAIVQTRYGSSDDLDLREIDRPEPGEGEVLVRVHASAVNDWEWGLVRGKPFYIRAFAGLFAPKKIPVIGCDVAGRVEAVGNAVEGVDVGDAVYGDLSEAGFGGFAEYLCAPAHALAPMPRNVTFAQAAALPHAGLLAYQALTRIAPLETARTMLINGAGGGVGVLALQMARRHPIEITGVDHGDKLDYLRSVGFDRVIDYTREDFTAAGRQYDLILDVKTNRSPFAYARALTPQGTYVTVGGTTPRLLQCLWLRRWIARRRDRHVRILGLKPNEGIEELTALVESGDMAPTVDSVHSLDEVPAAIERFGEARHHGKVIIGVYDEQAGAGRE